MDFEVSWSPEAVEDLQSIAEYIARDSGYYASAVVSELPSTSHNIGDIPRLYRIKC